MRTRWRSDWDPAWLVTGITWGLTPVYSLPEGGVRAAAEQRDCFPAVARDDRAVGTEAFAERVEQLRGRWRRDPPCDPVALADAEVVDGPDVEPAQLEHQEHLGRPAADAPHRHELGHELVVAQAR